jgi:hypothetical protein
LIRYKMAFDPLKPARMRSRVVVGHGDQISAERI